MRKGESGRKGERRERRKRGRYTADILVSREIEGSKIYSGIPGAGKGT